MPTDFPRIGFVLNAVAGLGGRVGLKGSDGSDTIAEAFARGARPMAADRALHALKSLVARRPTILTAGSSMGEGVCRALGLDCRIVYRPGTETTAKDTVETVRAFLAEGVDLILFAGGDGTARDVLSVAKTSTPIIGIPAGVKMYSGVFALSPAHAGTLASAYLAETGSRRLREAEVLDIDEESLRRDRPATRLFGYALVPRDRAIQNPKAAIESGADDELAALCQSAARELTTEGPHIVGPGSTMRRLMREAGLLGSLLGVDLVENGAVVGLDVTERAILERLDGRSGRVHVGVIGGTGCLFGRGNQPISPAVLARVGRSGITILASEAKLAHIGPEGFFVDTGDREIDRMLSGYIRVRTAPRREVIMRIQGPSDENPGWT